MHERWMLLMAVTMVGCSDDGRSSDSRGSENNPVVIDLSEAPSQYECGVSTFETSIGDEQFHYELVNRGLVNVAVVQGASANLRIACYSDEGFAIQEGDDGPGTDIECGVYDSELPFFFLVDGTISGGASYELCFYVD